MSCGVGHRRGLEQALLWLWCRLVITTPIRPPAWEPPYAACEALKQQKKKKMAARNSGFTEYRAPTKQGFVWAVAWGSAV